jgi:hypothetical protein
MDGMNAADRERHGVGPDEGERVAGLVDDVHADHVEAGPVVADGGAAGPAEQVQ